MSYINKDKVDDHLYSWYTMHELLDEYVSGVKEGSSKQRITDEKEEAAINMCVKPLLGYPEKQCLMAVSEKNVW